MTRPGTIGVLSSDLARYADFSVALMHCQTPPGSKLIWTKGADVVGNMNRMYRGMEGDWLWIMGDDHVFDSDLLLRLLEHDVDVVVPHCLKRMPPYDPVVYSGEAGEDHAGHPVYVGNTDMPKAGLVPVHACGSAGMLVRRHVFEALEKLPGEMFRSHGGLNEDLTFCADLREAGFQIYCDPSALLGHIALVSVWPEFRDGAWQIQLDLGNGVMMPVQRYLREEVLA